MRHISLAVLLAACTWSPPDHPAAQEVLNTISGSIVVATDVAEPSYALALVTFDNNPMPPDGTGRPATFAGVPASGFSPADAGLLAASYSVSHLDDGTYRITGFMDMDRDFHPTIDAMGGSTCGDIVGAHLADLTSTTQAAVTVEGGILQDDITLTLGLVTPLERPAFYLGDASGNPTSPTVSLAQAASGAVVTYDLYSTSIHAEWPDADSGVPLAYDLDGPYPVQNPNPLTPYDVWTGAQTCETAFYAWVKDDDMDGAPNDHPDYPGLGLSDIWPRLGLIYLGDPVDTDGDGAPNTFVNDLAEGEAWKAPGVVSPTMLIFGELPVGVPVLTNHLEIIFLPAGLHEYPSAEAECPGDWFRGTCSEVVQDISQIPRGAWSVTVISETGQTWTVPNASARSVPTDDSFKPARQGNWLEGQ